MPAKLKTATDAIRAAEEISRLLQTRENVTVDCADVAILTPSYVNAFVFTLLERHSLDDLKRRCVLRNRPDFVVDAITRSIERWMQGIRLSSQRPPVDAPSNATATYPVA